MNIGKMKKWSKLFIEKEVIINILKDVSNIDINMLENNYAQEIIKKILEDLIKFKINNIKFDGVKKFSDISEYEFSLIKATAKIEKNDKINMYFQIVEKNKRKESIFCYWSLIYDEEIKKHCIELDSKVIITELEIKDDKSSILLEIENNNTEILKHGTVVYFVDFIKYLKNNKNDKYKNIIDYLENSKKTTLLIGIKLNDSIKRL